MLVDRHQFHKRVREDRPAFLDGSDEAEALFKEAMDVLVEQFGPDHAQVAAAAGIAEYFDALDAHHCPDGNAIGRPERVRGLLHEAETVLLGRLLEGLARLPGLRLLGPSDPARRAATVSVVPQASSPQALARALAERGLMVGAGHFYAVRLLEALGVAPDRGVLRMSMVHYNSATEVERLLEALEDLL